MSGDINGNLPCVIYVWLLIVVLLFSHTFSGVIAGMLRSDFSAIGDMAILHKTALHWIYQVPMCKHSSLSHLFLHLSNIQLWTYMFFFTFQAQQKWYKDFSLWPHSFRMGYSATYPLRLFGEIIYRSVSMAHWNGNFSYASWLYWWHVSVYQYGIQNAPSMRPSAYNILYRMPFDKIQ